MLLEDLICKLEVVSIDVSGDGYEVCYYNFIKDKLPEYEGFWKLLVFPYRKKYDDFWLKINLPRNHEAICIYNYSIFRSALLINKYMEKAKIEYSEDRNVQTAIFDNCLIWLDIGFTQTCQLAGAIYKTFCDSRNYKNKKINEWEKCFKKVKGEIKEPNYTKMKEWLGNDIVREIINQRDIIRDIRNYIVHGPKFPGKANLIPIGSRDFLGEYLYWSKFHGLEKSNTNTIDRFELLFTRVNNFFEKVNVFWACVVKAYINSYFDKLPLNSDMLMEFWGANGTAKNDDSPSKWDMINPSGWIMRIDYDSASDQ